MEIQLIHWILWLSNGTWPHWHHNYLIYPLKCKRLQIQLQIRDAYWRVIPKPVFLVNDKNSTKIVMKTRPSQQNKYFFAEQCFTNVLNKNAFRMLFSFVSQVLLLLCRITQSHRIKRVTRYLGQSSARARTRHRLPRSKMMG
jgi:hypothetical protein